MKKIFLLISVILFIFPVQAQHTLRLMTYNIKNANGMDDICSFQRVANVINNASPDVVAIQEVDSMTRRSGQKYVLQKPERLTFRLLSDVWMIFAKTG